MIKAYINNMKYISLIIFLSLIILIGGCATQSHTVSGDNVPGFLHGILHGFIMLFGFIGSFFTDYRIYAVPNSGGWYDFGYLIGASMFFGGGTSSIR